MSAWQLNKVWISQQNNQVSYFKLVHFLKKMTSVRTRYKSREIVCVLF